MGLHITTSGPSGRAQLEGELTIHTVSALRDELGAQCADCLSIEIDLAGVTDIDTAGLQWMLMAKRMAAHAAVSFVNHSQAVIRMLELSNLERLIGDPLVMEAQP